MRRRLACVALGALLVSAVTTVSAGASGTQGRPPGSPDLATMSLAVTDFPAGARVVRQRYIRDREFVASYERDFSLGGTRVGRSSVLVVFTGLNVGRTLAEMRRSFGTLVQLMRTRRFRTAFATAVAQEADLSPRAVTVGRPRTPRVGDAAISFSIRVRQPGLTVNMTTTVLRVDRVLETILLVAVPNRRLFAADVDRPSRVAEIVAQSHKVEEWPELQELRGDRLSAIPPERLEEEFVHAFRGIVPNEKRFLGGETIGELFERVLPAVERILADESWDTLLAVLHGAVNRAILSYALTGERMFLGHFEQAPGCVNIVDVGPDWPASAIVRAVNVAPYDLLHASTRLTTMEGYWEEFRTTTQ